MIPKKRLDLLIPKAIEAIQDAGLTKNYNDEDLAGVPDSFHGYVSSFGADMIQTSPLAAAIFFEDDSGSKEKRGKIPLAILLTMRKELGEGIVPATYKKLSQYLRRNNGVISRREVESVAAAAIALKIALRTFKSIKQKSHAEP